MDLMDSSGLILPGIVIIVGVLIGGMYLYGAQVSRRKTRDLIRHSVEVMRPIGKDESYRWLGRTGCEIVLGDVKRPFKSGRVVVVEGRGPALALAKALWRLRYSACRRLSEIRTTLIPCREALAGSAHKVKGPGMCGPRRREITMPTGRFARRQIDQLMLFRQDWAVSLHGQP